VIAAPARAYVTNVNTKTLRNRTAFAAIRAAVPVIRFRMNALRLF
jgi:hypothetical protein